MRDFYGIYRIWRELGRSRRHAFGTALYIQTGLRLYRRS